MKSVPGKRSTEALVTIAMPVYNCAATLDFAIRSIVKQSFPDWELLILDDGSNDRSVEIAQRYSSPRIRVISDGLHRGLADRLNQAIALSRGKYFARMDGDDVSYPERLGLQVGYLEAHPEVDLLGGKVLVFGRGGRVLGTRECRTAHEHVCTRPWAGFHLAHPTWMGRIEWFRRLLYRPEALRCEDQDILLRSYETSRFAALPQIVLGYREGNLSLKNILAGRRSFSRLVIRRALSNREYGVACAALVEQAAKGAVDFIAIRTGLNHRLLRHRARPLRDAAAKQRWEEVWREVQEESGASGASPDFDQGCLQSAK